MKSIILFMPALASCLEFLPLTTCDGVDPKVDPPSSKEPLAEDRSGLNREECIDYCLDAFN